MGGYAREWPVRPPEWYAETLDGLGFEDLNVRLQVYVHHLESRDGVVEWVKGSLLTDYEKRMPPDSFSVSSNAIARCSLRSFPTRGRSSIPSSGS